MKATLVLLSLNGRLFEADYYSYSIFFGSLGDCAQQERERERERERESKDSVRTSAQEGVVIRAVTDKNRRVTSRYGQILCQRTIKLRVNLLDVQL